MPSVNDWISLLQESIAPSLQTAGGEAALLTRKLLGEPLIAEVTETLATPRQEHAAFMDYARSQASPGTAFPTLHQPPRHPQPGGSLARIQVMFGGLREVSHGRPIPRSLTSLLHSHNGETFTGAAPGEPLESWWYHELILLHGIASVAAITDDPRAWKIVEAGTLFHRGEIQSDHATADPWAIHAFALNPQTQDIAGGILNAAMIQYAGEPHGVGLVLLAEALYCLKHVVQTTTKRGKP